MKFSEEQKEAIKAAMEGKNIYIDAVIGAGKTTLLNEIASRLSGKEILYLTYNKLLKEDAKKKITLSHVEVHNYHGFVFKYLSRNGYRYTNSNGIKDFIDLVEDEKIKIPQYDVILIDEYQDIDEEIGDLIKVIFFGQSKEPQIIFVGDMAQKIYDKTKIDVIDDVLFKITNDFIKIDLTNCFRISKKFSDELSKMWRKKIIGVNENQTKEIIDFDPFVLKDIIDQYDNKDILILSPFRNNIVLNQFINFIEKQSPRKYNKRNLYVSIGENADTNKPVDDSMIVTTFDGSKGLERKLCIVFGWTEDKLKFRSQKGNKEITRNLFLVAASRGKEKIYFIKERQDKILTTKTFEGSLLDNKKETKFGVSKMFDFKYDVDIKHTFEMLEITEIPTENKEVIYAIENDYNILLGPAIGIYQEAMFFKEWNYERELESYDSEKPTVKYVRKLKPKTLEKKVLNIVACETDLTRYATQTIDSFIEEKEKEKLIARLKEHLDPNLETQRRLFLLEKDIIIEGRLDTIKNDVVYELKFVNELETVHFLQTAMYVLMNKSEKGILWNTKLNQMFEVRIKDKQEFLKRVIKTIKKEI